MVSKKKSEYIKAAYGELWANVNPIDKKRQIRAATLRGEHVLNPIQAAHLKSYLNGRGVDDWVSEVQRIGLEYDEQLAELQLKYGVNTPTITEDMLRLFDFNEGYLRGIYESGELPEDGDIKIIDDLVKEMYYTGAISIGNLLNIFGEDTTYKLLNKKPPRKYKYVITGEGKKKIRIDDAYWEVWDYSNFDIGIRLTIIGLLPGDVKARVLAISPSPFGEREKNKACINYTGSAYKSGKDVCVTIPDLQKVLLELPVVKSEWAPLSDKFMPVAERAVKAIAKGTDWVRNFEWESPKPKTELTIESVAKVFEVNEETLRDLSTTIEEQGYEQTLLKLTEDIVTTIPDADRESAEQVAREIMNQTPVDVILVTGKTYPGRREIKALGGLFNKGLGGWLVPVTKREEIEQLASQKGYDTELTTVNRADTRPFTYAERREYKAEKELNKAEQLRSRADRREEEIKSIEAELKPYDMAFWTEPIHPGDRGRKQRNLREALRAKMVRIVDLRKEAQELRDKADRMEGRVERRAESLVYMENRLKEAQANLRGVENDIAGKSSRSGYKPATGEWLEQLKLRKKDYEEQVKYWETKIEEAGGIQYSQGNVKVGDKVKIRGQWCTVVRVNPKTVTVDTPQRFKLKYNYSEIKSLLREEAEKVSVQITDASEEDLEGASQRGWLSTNYNDIEEKLGKPSKIDEPKISVIWINKINGEVFSIYAWKKIIPPEEVKEWNIGGLNDDILPLLYEVFPGKVTPSELRPEESEESPKEKEIWEYTKAEYIEHRLATDREYLIELKKEDQSNLEYVKDLVLKKAAREHEAAVITRVAEHEPVPFNVLDDYPELKKKEPWEMSHAEFVHLYETDYNDNPHVFAERVGKPLDIKSQAGEPLFQAYIEGEGLKTVGESGTLPRDRWRRAIVRWALISGKDVPDAVLADFPDLKRKEPWEMTHSEYMNLPTQEPYFSKEEADYVRAVSPESIDEAVDFIRARKIKEALSRDQPVSLEVLKDFPDLMPTEPAYEETEEHYREALAALGIDYDQVSTMLIPDGLAKGKDIMEFDLDQIKMGVKVEREHTKDPYVALEIAMDHLTEFHDYYTRLERMEAEAKAEKKAEDRYGFITDPVIVREKYLKILGQNPGWFEIAKIEGGLYFDEKCNYETMKAVREALVDEGIAEVEEKKLGWHIRKKLPEGKAEKKNIPNLDDLLAVEAAKEVTDGWLVTIKTSYDQGYTPEQLKPVLATQLFKAFQKYYTGPKKYEELDMVVIAQQLLDMVLYQPEVVRRIQTITEEAVELSDHRGVFRGVVTGAYYDEFGTPYTTSRPYTTPDVEEIVEEEWHHPLLDKIPEAIHLTDGTTPADIDRKWIDLLNIEEEIKKDTAPQIEALEKELKTIKGQRDKESTTKRKQLRAKIEELASSSALARAMSEQLFIAAQDELRNRLLPKLEAAGITGEIEQTEAMDLILSSLTERPYIEHTWKMTIAEIVEEIIEESKPKPPSALDTATIRKTILEAFAELDDGGGRVMIETLVRHSASMLKTEDVIPIARALADLVSEGIFLAPSGLDWVIVKPPPRAPVTQPPEVVKVTQPPEVVEGRIPLLADVLFFPSVIIIGGGRRKGKTATGYLIVELAPTDKKFVLGLPETVWHLLPNSITPLPLNEDVLRSLPNDSVFLIDEASLFLYAKEHKTSIAKVADEIILKSAQRGQTFIFISHNLRKLYIGTVMEADMLIFKELSYLQAQSERPEIKPFMKDVQEAFNQISPPNLRVMYAFVISSRYTGMVETPLPSFWKEELSLTWRLAGDQEQYIAGAEIDEIASKFGEVGRNSFELRKKLPFGVKEIRIGKEVKIIEREPIPTSKFDYMIGSEVFVKPKGKNGQVVTAIEPDQIFVKVDSEYLWVLRKDIETNKK